MEALKKTRQDIIVMALLMIVSLFFYFVFIPSQIPMSANWSGNVSFSSRTFPSFLMVALFITTGIGLIRGIIRYAAVLKKGRAEAAVAKHDKKEIFKIVAPYITYVFILLYCVLFQKIGYIFSTLLVPPVLMFFLGCRKWLTYIGIYVFAAILYAVFKLIMRVPLP
jgi:hypothetical protein